MEETTTEAEATTEANAAAAGQEETASPTLRQLEDPPMLLLLLFHRGLVVGTKSLERRASSVQLIAHSSKNIRQNNNSRETPTGAGVSERGDPLLIIIN